MTFKQRAAIAAVGLLLSSCGGSDSSGSGGTTLPPVAATPTPTPKPSPSYSTYNDPLADWRAGPPFVLSQSTTIRESGVDSNVKVSIQAADMVEVTFSGRPNITANFADFTRGRFSNFSAADIDGQNERLIHFQKSDPDNGHWILGRWQPNVGSDLLQYCALIFADHSYASGSDVSGEYIELDYQFVIGSRTLSSDLPTPISETVYASDMAVGGFYRRGNIPGYTSGDLTLSKTGALSGKLTDRTGGPYLGLVTGSMDQQTHRITGDITAENGTYVGKFEGYLYGPKGKEMGLIVYIKNADGTVATTGTIFGRSRYLPPSL